MEKMGMKVRGNGDGNRRKIGVQRGKSEQHGKLFWSRVLVELSLLPVVALGIDRQILCGNSLSDFLAL
jgi:hypothetical protein